MTDEQLIIEILENAEDKLTRHQILDQIETWGPIDAKQASNGAHLRQLIQNIRRKQLTEDKILLSDSTGYWLSDDQNEISLWVAKQMKRAQEHNNTAEYVSDHLAGIQSHVEIIESSPEIKLRIKDSAKQKKLS